MNNKIQKPSEWLNFLHTTIKTFSGQLSVDKKYVIDWQISDIIAPELATMKTNVASLAGLVLAPAEVEFIKQNPEATGHGVFTQSCTPLLEAGPDKANWKEIETMVQRAILQFYTMDITRFGQEVIKPLLDDLYFFATMKKARSNEIIGFIICSITPAYPHGDIKMINLVVDPIKQYSEQDKLLMSSILSIIPGVKRIFLGIRPTNAAVYKKYSSWGFTTDNKPLQDDNHQINPEHYKILEYNVEHSNVLQECASKIVLD